MPQPEHISALPVADPEALDEDLQELFALCIEKLGIVPNVLRAYTLRPQKLRNFVAMYQRVDAGAVGSLEARAGDGRGRRVERQPVLLLPCRARPGGAAAVP